MSITVDAFLERIQRRVSLPANQATLSEDNMLVMADDVMRERIVPLVLSVNQNFFVYPTSQVLTDGVDTYDIPYRSIGRTLRELKCQNGSSTSVFNLALIDLEDEHKFGTSGEPFGFYFEGDKYVIVPSPNGSQYTALIWYDLQPSSFVKLEDCALVVSVSSADVTVSSVPSNLVAGTTIDFIQGKSGSSILGMDKDISSVASPVITFASASDVPTTLVAGDYIAEAGKTPVIQLPNELVGLLELWTCERMLYSVGDYEGSNKLMAMSEPLEMMAKKILAPRVQGESTKIVNRTGLLRGRGFNSGRRVRGGYYP